MSAMFGKKVKEYVRFEQWILILIVVVFALRLGLSLAGVSKAEYPFITRTGIQTPLPKGTVGKHQSGSSGGNPLLRHCRPAPRIRNL